MNRRTLLAGLGLSSVALPLLARAEDARANSDEEVTYLFVQTAQGTKLADGRLELSGVDLSTLYFSDRPERIVGHLSTSRFVEHWGAGAGSFESDPPNATLAIAGGDEPQLVVVVLTNPSLQADTLTYDVEVLEGDGAVGGGPSSLFIDTIGRPLSPTSVAGVHRRRRRRRHAIAN